MRFDAKVEELDNVIAYIEGELEKLNAPTKVIMQMAVAVEEIFVNIAHYAYAEDNIGGPAEVSVISHDNMIDVIFEDEGVEFDPLAKADPDVSLEADDRQIGGLGIFMVKKSMDSVEYRRDGGKNILTIKKSW